jgi:hypothetical protein
MGRGILLWLLGVPIPIIHPSRALLALTELKLHRTLRSSKGRLFCLGIGTRPESSRQASGRHVVGREARRTMPSLN